MTEQAALFLKNVIDKIFIPYTLNLELYTKTELTFITANNLDIKRNIEYSVGRKCALEAIQLIDPDYSVTPGANKDGSVKWPKEFTGSITHSKGIALAVVGKITNFDSIGVDVEKIVSIERAYKLISRIATENERRTFNNISQEVLFSIIFSSKEALFKALYPLTGNKFYFKDVKITFIDLENHSLQLKLLKTLSSQHIAGNIYRVVFFINYEYIVSLVCIKSNKI
jgi:enterobactin synthetase component D